MRDSACARAALRYTTYTDRASSTHNRGPAARKRSMTFMFPTGSTHARGKRENGVRGTHEERGWMRCTGSSESRERAGRGEWVGGEGVHAARSNPYPACALPAPAESAVNHSTLQAAAGKITR
ncbi:hypothetical protein GCM10008959_13580 [Deinococcus seoulensis]|uniref:Uncharacterized protein n=1 Tax=Deinococcus seoulensis TaxID=1837379 RepID=A0ABQ2RTI0_9DEIO|nr:hypothetical protein GCM10008959_13580 [Deinococcus seoulensis]